ncbi:MAG: MtrB/PioB family outer membrane beta-barrel protein, partial [Magnetococcus sp. YQC-5]
MSKLKHALAHTTCVTVLLVFGTGPAWSEQEPKKNQANPWDMSPTAAPFTTPDSSISVGVGYLDGQRQQLGTFDGQRSSHGSLLFDAKIIKRDEATGTWITTQGRNLGMDSNREVKVDLERQGEWGFRVDYNEIPRVTPYSVNSKTEGLGTTTQTIPKTTTSGDGATVQIRTDRERVSLNTFRALNSKIKFNLNFRNETKEGTRQWGRGGSNEFALEPVDWTIRQLEPTLSFTGDRLQLLGGYNGSWFRNENNLVDTILKGNNPATLTNHAYLTLPLNNEAHQIFLGGGYHFTPDTRGTFKISYSRALQNEHIPTTDITGLSIPNAPSSLQGRVDNTLLQLGL